MELYDISMPSMSAPLSIVHHGRDHCPAWRRPAPASRVGAPIWLLDTKTLLLQSTEPQQDPPTSPLAPGETSGKEFSSLQGPA